MKGEYTPFPTQDELDKIETVLVSKEQLLHVATHSAIRGPLTSSQGNDYEFYLEPPFQNTMELELARYGTTDRTVPSEMASLILNLNSYADDTFKLIAGDTYWGEGDNERYIDRRTAEPEVVVEGGDISVPRLDDTF